MKQKNANIPQGLTRVILDELVNASSELEDPKQFWTPQQMDVLEEMLLESLQPAPDGKGRLLFDTVFRRSFREARDMFSMVMDMAADETKHTEPMHAMG